MLARCFFIPSYRLISRIPETSLRSTYRGINTSVSLHRAQLIDGKKVASDIYKELSAEIQSIEAQGKRAPHLVLVRIGSDPASGSYVKNKMKAAEEIGMHSTIHHLPEDTSQSSLISLINELNIDPDVDGILVQLPLPPHMEEKTVCNAVAPKKDVDGFHIINIGSTILHLQLMDRRDIRQSRACAPDRSWTSAT